MSDMTLIPSLLAIYLIIGGVFAVSEEKAISGNRHYIQNPARMLTLMFLWPLWLLIIAFACWLKGDSDDE